MRLKQSGMKKLISVDGVVLNSGLWALTSLQTQPEWLPCAVDESTKATLTSSAVAQLKTGPDAVFHNNSQPWLSEAAAVN